MLHGFAALRGGGDHIVDLILFKEIQDVGGALLQLADGVGRHHVGIEGQRSAAGGVNGEAQCLKLLGDGDDLLLVGIPDSDEHPAFFLTGHLVTGGAETLEQRFLKGAADAQHLAGGFHLRPQVDIHIVELLKAEHRDFDRHIIGMGIQASAVAQIGQLGAQHDLGGQIHHGYASHLADIGYGAGGAGVDLDDINLPFVDNILDVDQADDIQLPGQLAGVVDDGGPDLLGEVLGRIDGDGVAGVDARPLDVLHDAGDQVVMAVADGVYLHLGAHHVLIDEHGVFQPAGGDDLHVLHHILLRMGDDHVLAAQHVGGAQQDGIFQILGGFDRFLGGEDGVAGGAGDAAFLQQLVKPLPVLGGVDAVGAGAQNVDALLLQVFGQFDGSLAAELDHAAPRLLHLQDTVHILGGQGVKVQPVGGVEVGGDSLRVVVDDNGLAAFLFQRPDAVNRTVVEFNALADADGAGAEYQNLLFA